MHTAQQGNSSQRNCSGKFANCGSELCVLIKRSYVVQYIRILCIHSALAEFYFYYQHKLFLRSYVVFTTRCTLMQSAVLRSHVVCLSVTLVDCDHSHRLEFFENNFAIS